MPYLDTNLTESQTGLQDLMFYSNFDTVCHNIGLSNKYAKTIHFVGELLS